MISVVHVIVGLDRGGAEMMLRRLIESHLKSESNYRHTVISLTDIGFHGDALQEQGVEVYPLGLRTPLGLLRALPTLVHLLRRLDAGVVQTWMYHADLMGGWSAWFAGRLPVIWGIHACELQHGVSKVTRFIQGLCAWSSSFIPTRILCAAEAARQAHALAGYDLSKCIVLPNGFDVSTVTLSPDDRRHLRGTLGVREDELLVGIVGRFNPAKDFQNFIRASAQVLAKRVNVRFLMVGDGTDVGNFEINAWISELGLDSARFIRVGFRSDVSQLLSAMDVFCSSSRSEAFPLVVGEAMSMARPCVVTDVGDAARLVGNAGVLVPPMDASALARGLLQVLAMSPAQREKLGSMARERVAAEFSMQRYMSALEQVYAEAMGEGR